MGSVEHSLERIAVALETLVSRIAAEPQEMQDSAVRLPPCPYCSETEALEASPVMGFEGRVTCKQCGKSYTEGD